MRSFDGAIRAANGDALCEKIITELEEDIVFGRLKPGQKLPEEELSDRFGASRHQVREALMRLFTPELIVWFTDLGDGAPVVEYWMGTLVVSTRVACIADDEYDALLDAAQRIAAQVLAQGVSQRPSLA